MAGEAAAANALGMWAPPGVLALAAVIGFTLWWRSFTRRLDEQTAALAKRLDAQDAALQIIHTDVTTLRTDLSNLREKLPEYATRDALGRLGDRMDGRITNLAERVAVLEAVRGVRRRSGDT